MSTTPPNCPRHGEEMGFRRDTRYRRGGFWKCRACDNDAQRTRYDADPVHRLEKLEKHAKRRRLQRLERRRAETAPRPELVNYLGRLRGSLQEQRRD